MLNIIFIAYFFAVFPVDQKINLVLPNHRLIEKLLFAAHWPLLKITKIKLFNIFHFKIFTIEY